jgi:hypothetical protein
MQGDRGSFVLLMVMLGAGVLPSTYVRSQGNGGAGGASRAEKPASGKKKGNSGAKPRGKRRERPDTADGRLHELFDAFDPGLSVDKASAVEVAKQYRSEGRGRIFALVATAPDPDKSSFDASYDQTLDAG